MEIIGIFLSHEWVWYHLPSLGNSQRKHSENPVPPLYSQTGDYEKFPVYIVVRIFFFVHIVHIFNTLRLILLEYVTK